MTIDRLVLLEDLTCYFRELDTAVDKLSHMHEGLLAALPTWVLQRRHVRLAMIERPAICVYKVEPDSELEQDQVEVLVGLGEAELCDLTAPYSFKSMIGAAATGTAFEIGDMRFLNANNPLLPEKHLFRGMIGYCFTKSARERFSVGRARKEAVNLWCNAQRGFDPLSSYPGNARRVFDKFGCLIKRKNYRERKIHRYISEHRGLLLPDFKNCFFEHGLFSKTEKVVADFILQRECMLPALLIELESPCLKLLKTNGDLTFQASHAREQIRIWVKIIDENPANWDGKMAFLKGPKERLVVMGKGFESDAYDSSRDDTKIWTYDVLLREAKDSFNRRMAEMYRLVNTDNPPVV